MSITKYAANKNLDYNFGKVSFTPPTNFYLGLSTTSISSSGSNATEPTGGSAVGYARVAITNDKTGWTYASNGCLVNATDVTFGQSSGSWGTISYLGVWDTLTSGSIWYFTTLSTPKAIPSSTTVLFSASTININIT